MYSSCYNIFFFFLPQRLLLVLMMRCEGLILPAAPQRYEGDKCRCVPLHIPCTNEVLPLTVDGAFVSRTVMLFDLMVY